MRTKRKQKNCVPPSKVPDLAVSRASCVRSPMPCTTSRRRPTRQIGCCRTSSLWDPVPTDGARGAACAQLRLLHILFCTLARQQLCKYCFIFESISASKLIGLMYMFLSILHAFLSFHPSLEKQIEWPESGLATHEEQEGQMWFCKVALSG